MANKIFSFVNEVKLELGKVTWPNRSELVHSTIVVIIATILLGIFIGICDFILSKTISFILKF